MGDTDGDSWAGNIKTIFGNGLNACPNPIKNTAN